MASIVLNRSDLWPVGTSVSAYPGRAHHDGRAPNGTATASATVAADGSLTLTGLTADTQYVASAVVNGEPRRLNINVSTFDRGTTSGTGDTTSGSVTVANATGSWTVGMRITGPGIPPGTYVKGVSGATLTLTDKATASATGVALQGAEGLTSLAKLKRRRVAIGTAI